MTRVTIDRPTGALRIAGEKVFPLGLSNPPPLGSTTPGGKDGLHELAEAGATFVRTGRGNWSLVQLGEQVATERAQLDAAATNGLLCWLYLGDVPDLPPHTSGQQVLTSAADRRGQRRLHVLEEDLPAGERRAVELLGQAREADTRGGAAASGCDQVEEAPVAPGNEVHVLRSRLDARSGVPVRQRRERRLPRLVRPARRPRLPLRPLGLPAAR